MQEFLYSPNPMSTSTNQRVLRYEVSWKYSLLRASSIPFKPRRGDPREPPYLILHFRLNQITSILFISFSNLCSIHYLSFGSIA